MIKKLSTVFVFAFILNIIWENLHSVLYMHYEGSAITELILLRAALFDALFITILAILFFTVTYFNRRIWYALVFGIVFAVTLELYALETGRWAYTELMPVLPFIGTGITPTFQLGLLSYFIYTVIVLKEGENKSVV